MSLTDNYGTSIQRHYARYFVEFSRPAGALYMKGWDTAFIADEQLPGLVEIDDAAANLRKNPNAKPGSHGGRPIFLGLDDQVIKIRVIVWTNQQLELLWALRPLLVPLPGTQPKNVSIVSEWLKMTGISTVAIHGATDIKPYSGQRVARGLQMTITATRWVGAAKDANKNVTTQPRRTYATTRPFTAPQREPTTVAGACAPNFQPG